MKEIKAICIPYSPGNPYQKQLIEKLKKINVNVIPAEIKRFFSILTPVKFSWKPDILHLHWLHRLMIGRNRLKTVLKSTFFLIEIVILNLLGIKVIWTVHNLRNHERKFEKIEFFFTRMLILLCRYLIVHSQAAGETVKTTFRLRSKKKIVVIPHGNYNEYYENKISREAARNILEIDKKKFVFLSFGKIRKYKGYTQLIDIFKDYNNPECELVIAGEPFNEEIKEEIQSIKKGNSNIKIYPRFIEESEVQVFMNAADVVVLPYEEILTSGAAILAMSFLKPVIAPSFQCIKEILEENDNFLYDFSKDTGLLDAMSSAYSNKDKLETMGNNNFTRVRIFSWDGVANQTAAIYHK